MKISAFETLEVDQAGHALQVVINRPKALNALSRQVVEDLHALVDRIVDQVGHEGAWPVRGLLLSGAGNKAFVAGADIREMAAMSAEQAAAYSARMHELTLRLEELPVPVIACVDGFALGGGCELAMACDFIFATEASIFGQPEVNLGLVPGFGATVRLQQLIGRARAKELVYTGRRVDAGEAQRIGLVHTVFPTAHAMLDAAAATVEGISEKSAVAVANCKLTINAATGTTTARGLEIENDSFRRAFDTADMEEGVRAFLAREVPVFPGR